MKFAMKYLMRFVNCLFFMLIFISIVGCATTAPTILSHKKTSQPLSLRQAKVAVFSFAGSPNSPETGSSARELTMALLTQTYNATIISPSKVDAYQKKNSITPTEYDLEVLKSAASFLGADVVIWGSINQYTPYKFDRLAPATPPYVELTIFALRADQSDVAKASGHKQGGIPATIWNRQPTFNDVAQPLIKKLLTVLN